MRNLSLALMCVLLVVAVRGAENSTQVQDFSAPLTSSPHAQTSWVFPDHPTLRLPSGEIIEVLLGFTNTGRKTFNITSLAASLNHPQDFKYYIQNYTRFDYGVLVHPDEQISLTYMFRPDALLEPREFGLIVSVFYHDEIGGNFTTAFFNGTIRIVDPDNGFDFQQGFIYFGLFGIVGLLGFLAFQQVNKKTRHTKKTPATYVEVGTVSKSTPVVNLDNEWLEGTHAVSPTRQRPTKDPKKK